MTLFDMLAVLGVFLLAPYIWLVALILLAHVASCDGFFCQPDRARCPFRRARRALLLRSGR